MKRVYVRTGKLLLGATIVEKPWSYDLAITANSGGAGDIDLIHMLAHQS